ncbi:gephyrin-like molybdotransferase Glp [Aquimarina brevivitae]|uniref:Molybdopterin molybdenumtransferase n=1 Tax=Aquimarina brevivitae TaxID=323412 RepID=A0A4Q7NYK5_9FLAO|nr:gephyrin-like molybdotransferase Glp [Aquimarina brevivitae]RZS92526.1 molybdopterin molybdochelatase [Aquimarina brevivitae]
MISVPEAISFIQQIPISHKIQEVPLSDAGYKILGRTTVSKINMPPFRQSAMDGYAVQLHNSAAYKVIGEIKAGDAVDIELAQGEAVRIFTGAPVPKTANCIIIQEHTERKGDYFIATKNYTANQNIRPVGEQIKEGDIALKKGTMLTPAAIGFLAGLGFAKVPILPAPKVGIITTGNELVEPGNPLPTGKIYESNTIQLQACLSKAGINGITTYKVQDDYPSTVNTIANAMANNDLILISGGISVGDYDFVKEALQELAVKQTFYKVNQKPGKPLYFGTHDQTYIFALPGNPASSLTCFYIYVIPLLHRLLGYPHTGLKKAVFKLSKALSKPGSRAQFLKAQVKDGECHILEGQNSSMLHTYSVANALAYIPENLTSLQAGENIEVYLLP